MKYTFACKRVPLNDSIKEYAQKKISKLERYFREEDTTAFVTFSVEKDHLCSVEITIRGGATLLRAQTEAPDGDMRGAIDAAVGYIERQMRDVEQYRKLQSRPLPLDLDYNEVDSLRLEARQKLNAVKPLNFGQAARISGVSPADITALMIYIETHKKEEKA